MEIKELLTPQPVVGMRVNFDSDKYCDWGPSEGHYVTDVDGVKLTLCRDTDSYKSDKRDPSDIEYIYLNEADHIIDEVANRIDFK